MGENGGGVNREREGFSFSCFVGKNYTIRRRQRVPHQQIHLIFLQKKKKSEPPFTRNEGSLYATEYVIYP